MTRLPREGKNKTRLIPALGAKGAAAFHDRLARHAIGRASAFCLTNPEARLTVRIEGGTTIQAKSWLGDDSVHVLEQSPGDLGQRMESAALDAFAAGAKKVIIIGTDCPSISESTLSEAFSALEQNDLIYGPAEDGGYYLIGLSKPVPEVFREIEWGESKVLSTSLAAAKSAKRKTALLPTLSDVDYPEDLPAAKIQLAQGETLSVIIPTLNEESGIGQLIEKISQSNPYEIIVADGGSTDRTREIVTNTGATLIESKLGRSHQMNAAAATATGELLLFLHADTQLPKNFPTIISETLKRPNTSAAAFTFQLDNKLPAAPLIEALVHLRCFLWKTPYGDQGISLRRSIFHSIGGFPEWETLEDVGIIQHLGKTGQIRIVPEPAITSSRRWREGGLIRTFLRHQLMLMAYKLRIPISLIAKIR